jgi:hypothetical protein
MPKKISNEIVSIPMVGENELILPEYFVQKNKKKVKKNVNGKKETFIEDVYKLVNPMTKTRHLAKRNGEPVIKLIRKPIKEMVLDETNREIPLSKFSKSDRLKIKNHFEKIEIHKDKSFWDIPESEAFVNAERGRPERLPINIQLNKERKKAGYKTLGQIRAEEKAKKPKKGKHITMNLDFEPQNKIVEEVIETPKKRIKINVIKKHTEEIIEKPKKQSYTKYETDEERKEAIKQQKKESAKRAEKRPYKKYETEEERKEAIKQQKRESAKRNKYPIPDIFKESYNDEPTKIGNKPMTQEEKTNLTKKLNQDNAIKRRTIRKILYSNAKKDPNEKPINFEYEKKQQEKADEEFNKLFKLKKKKKISTILGTGIKEDIKNFGNKIVKGVKNLGHTIVHKTNETTNTIKHQSNDKFDKLRELTEQIKTKGTNYVNAIIKGRNDLPPKVRDILSKYGDNLIDTITICRTPVPGILTGALSAISGGAFGQALKNSPYDKLFHLFIRISIDNGMVLTMEKNEVINMDIDPPIPKDTEQKSVNIPLGMTSNELMEGAKRIQGGKFFNYSARDNNCQDFILAIFNGSNIGNQEDRDFIKQDTKGLFGDNVGLRKFSNTVTDLGGIANTVMTGAGIENIDWGSFTKYFKNRPKKLKHLTTLDQLATYIINHPKDFSKLTLKRALFYEHVVKKKSIHNNMGRKKVYHSDSDSDSDMEGEGIKELWNNSKFGKTINNSVRKHKGVIDAVRNDPTVQNFYHGKHISPYHKDIDAVVNHFGSGLGTGIEGSPHHGGVVVPYGYGLYAGNPSGGSIHGGIHHHHHIHIEGQGMWDWADPKKNGVAKAFDPNQNGVAKAFQPITNVVQQIPVKKNQFEDLGKLVRDQMEKHNINNKGALQGLKTAGHYAIPATTSALGGIAGTTLGALTTGGLGSFAGGIAGSAAGSYAGDKINQKLGIGLHKRKGRFVKGSQEAKEHMRRIREMKRR